MDGERQHEPFDYRTKCIDDHEQRLRHLEANGKEQTKLFVMSEKLEGQIHALDEKTSIRLNAIEKLVDTRIAVLASEKATCQEQKIEKKDWNSDLVSYIALAMSGTLLALRIMGK
jgi:hypothetical protein